MKLSAICLTIGLLFTCSTSMAAPSSDPCTYHFECSDLEVCVSGKCESAVGRTYVVTVVSAKVSEKRQTAPAQGKSWDVLGGLPDPKVRVYFPSINKMAFEAPGKRDTTTPVWNLSKSIVVTAAGQEIWFCFYDQDSGSPDKMMTSSAGTGNCRGYDNVIDFVRAGEMEFTTDGDIKSFKARIKRK